MTVLALKNLYYHVNAIGDSYNDITMLKEAEKAILFRPPDNVRAEFPQFPIAMNYREMKCEIQNIIDGRHI